LGGGKNKELIAENHQPASSSPPPPLFSVVPLEIQERSNQARHSNDNTLCEQ
jgi:hypothetical protein